MYFIGAYGGEVLLGIGGAKIMHDDGDYGEIKNLFVDPKARGRGVSKKIMQALEDYLDKNRIFLCRLETGVSQPESIGLYKSLGYEDKPLRYLPDAIFLHGLYCILPRITLLQLSLHHGLNRWPQVERF